MIKENIEVTKDDINERSGALQQQLIDLQTSVSELLDKKKALTKGPVSVRDKKLRELRAEIQKLEQCDKWLQDYKKSTAKHIDFLNKECINVDTRLFTTKQLISREIEKNY